MIEELRIPRLLIGAAGSGSGKTTFTCGLLMALLNMGKNPVAFKCGPDFIDPMFHKTVLGIPCRNLDLFLSDEKTIAELLCKHGQNAGISIVEGVMGYYDGLGGISTDASSFDLARKTRTPAVLLVDGCGKSVSILAEIKGFIEFHNDSQIRGVVLNRVSGAIYPEIKSAIERTFDVSVLGYLPNMEECSLKSRHLGLITAEEVGNLQQIIETLGKQIEKTVDLNALLALAENAPALRYCREPENPESIGAPVKIGIAKDKAFCFYYDDNLDLLREQGAELMPFSPLSDQMLPKGIQGLIIGGGYPELYLNELSANKSIRNEIRLAIESGIPCIAECGGFMYLHDSIDDGNGGHFPMVGAVNGESFPTDKLQRFGYIDLTANEDTLLCETGKELHGHEFHYWDSTNPGDAFFAQKPLRKKSWRAIISKDNLFAGYPHIYFYGMPEVAERFLKRCKEFNSDSRLDI